LGLTQKKGGVHHGRPNPLGEIADDGEGKSEEGKEIDLDGLLQ
jgi:hypothetical protein